MTRRNSLSDRCVCAAERQARSSPPMQTDRRLHDDFRRREDSLLRYGQGHAGHLDSTGVGYTGTAWGNWFSNGIAQALPRTIWW